MYVHKLFSKCVNSRNYSLLCSHVYNCHYITMLHYHLFTVVYIYIHVRSQSPGHILYVVMLKFLPPIYIMSTAIHNNNMCLTHRHTYNTHRAGGGEKVDKPVIKSKLKPKSACGRSPEIKRAYRGNKRKLVLIRWLVQRQTKNNPSKESASATKENQPKENGMDEWACPVLE